MIGTWDCDWGSSAESKSEEQPCHSGPVQCGNTPELPPKNVGFTPDNDNTVELLDEAQSCVARVESRAEVETIYAHLLDERICQGIVSGALTIN